MDSACTAPVEEFLFLLHDVLCIDQRDDLPGFADLTPDLTRPILQGMIDFASGVLAPLNAVGDREGCALENGVVRTPPGFGDAYRAYCAAGWNRLTVDEVLGGEGLAGVIGTAASEICASANPAIMLYPGLTRGAMSSIARAGTEWMREHVVPRMVSGEWTGTMCLTEPGCGTDLRLMTTRATPLPDGRFRIDGTKIFISGGDHDLAGNIVHLVLAKLPDAEGRYIDDLATVALFMVPKMDLGEVGQLTGLGNGVSVGGLEAKMGLKGSATTVLNFDGAIGWKLGSTREPAGQDSKSSGMSAMFDMMNGARLGTGVQAIATAAAAYAKGAAYAKQRLSGRAASPSDRSGERADPIIVHPDVRRMLLKQASFIEGARALALWVSLLLDEQARHPNAGQRATSGAMASLLTPVIKAYCSDKAFEASNLAVQVLGGHGYIRDNGVEQHVRDGRIFQLYEGANGIQALDLVTRKLPAQSGLGVVSFISQIEALLAEMRPYRALTVQADALAQGLSDLGDALALLRETGSDRNAVASAASDVLAIFGIVALGFTWGRIGLVAVRALDRKLGDPGFLRRKLALGDFWALREMPQIAAHLAAARAGSRSLMTLAAADF
jgi:alkylation response protein AidB-like acyl-CoA dehydrogenase